MSSKKASTHHHHHQLNNLINSLLQSNPLIQQHFLSSKTNLPTFKMLFNTAFSVIVAVLSAHQAVASAVPEVARDIDTRGILIATDPCECN